MSIGNISRLENNIKFYAIKSSSYDMNAQKKKR